MVAQVWVLRDALGRVVMRHEFIVIPVYALYRRDRASYNTFADLIHKNSYADSHRAGGYTLTREEG